MNARSLFILSIIFFTTSCATRPLPAQMYPGKPKPLDELAFIQLDWINSLKKGSANMLIASVDDKPIKLTGFQTALQATVLPGNHKLGINLVRYTGGIATGGWEHTKKYQIDINVTAGNLYAVCYLPGDLLAFRNKGPLKVFQEQEKWDDIAMHPCKEFFP
ncbi:hypothetical protein [Chromobacterium phragmitis]|uniref:CNP1-like uncharacterized domain-containing protein n=1 Tax=Chromobacterium phragmitis TaxID=2202141 RepID=A0ABV0IW84_9NEIS